MSSLGALDVVLEIDAVFEKLCFKAVPELEQKIILGMDFCKLVGIEIKTGEGIWRIAEGEWRAFAEAGDSETATIFAECAGISTLEARERECVTRLLEGILTKQSAESGVTRL